RRGSALQQPKPGVRPKHGKHPTSSGRRKSSNNTAIPVHEGGGGHVAYCICTDIDPHGLNTQRYAGRTTTHMTEPTWTENRPLTRADKKVEGDT
ncbi:Hypothetical predicted protein, partial [Pelobates cultripes]